MTNAWSLLFDELNMFKQDYSGDDNIDLSSHVVGGTGTDSLSLESESLTFNVEVPRLPDTPSNQNGFWKYHEDVILKEIREYLGGTYNAHYASPESKTQTLDLIEGIGDAEPFCRSNAIKYLSRFGKKGGKSTRHSEGNPLLYPLSFQGLCNET